MANTICDEHIIIIIIYTRVLPTQTPSGSIDLNTGES